MTNNELNNLYSKVSLSITTSPSKMILKRNWALAGDDLKRIRELEYNKYLDLMNLMKAELKKLHK